MSLRLVVTVQKAEMRLTGSYNRSHLNFSQSSKLNTQHNQSGPKCGFISQRRLTTATTTTRGSDHFEYGWKHQHYFHTTRAKISGMSYLTLYARQNCFPTKLYVHYLVYTLSYIYIYTCWPNVIGHVFFPT